MPRYNIEFRAQEHLRGTHAINAECPDAAGIESARFIGELIKDHADEIWRAEEWRIDVINDDGLILFILQLVVTKSPASSS